MFPREVSAGDSDTNDFFGRVKDTTYPSGVTVRNV